MATYEELKEIHTRPGKNPWKDPEFPTDDTMLYFNDSIGHPIEWKRPLELDRNAVFIDELSYHDINQKILGDCYFLSSVASVLAQDKALLKRVIPEGQNFGHPYAGIFRFKFWKYGNWKEILIDDQLPVYKNELIYTGNKKGGDYWICLLEKAYAKLHGSYLNIHGGFPMDALVELTGGVSYTIPTNSNECHENSFFERLQRMWAMDTLIALTTGEKKDSDIQSNHAYAVTGLDTVDIGNNEHVHLIRILNPWGKTEWHGTWGDKSPEWNRVSESDRKRLDRKIKEDGEFWMGFEDALREFFSITFCHKSEPTWSSSKMFAGDRKKKWSTINIKDRWIEHICSGGSDIKSDFYWRNPQYTIKIDQQIDTTMVTISLMKIMNERRDNLNIQVGFDLYQLKPGSKEPPFGRFDNDLIKLSKRERREAILNEETDCWDLTPGIYVVIVFNKQMVTFDYLLRIFSERPVQVRAAGDRTDPFLHDEKEVGHIDTIYKHVKSSELGVDAFEMKSIIEKALRTVTGNIPVFKISVATARALMTFAKFNHIGEIKLEDVKKIYKAVMKWLKAFGRYAETDKNSINIFELANLLHALDFQVDGGIVETAFCHYGNQDRRLTFDDFVQCVCRLHTSIEIREKSFNMLPRLDEALCGAMTENSQTNGEATVNKALRE